MSEAAKVLMERAMIVGDRAAKEYEAGMTLLNNNREEALEVFHILSKAAKEVCDHDEVIVTKGTRVERGTHGRGQEDIETTNCKICGKHIKTVEV